MFRIHVRVDGSDPVLLCIDLRSLDSCCSIAERAVPTNGATLTDPDSIARVGGVSVEVADR